MTNDIEAPVTLARRPNPRCIPRVAVVAAAVCLVGGLTAAGCGQETESPAGDGHDSVEIPTAAPTPDTPGANEHPGYTYP
jgi:hypothetical protein